MKQLWTEKYRPADVDGYVFRDNDQKAQVKSWIKDGAIPHLLFSGAPGVGKTTLAKILIAQLDVNEYDVLEINASRENSIDTIRDKITGFVQTMPFGDFKVVLLDEADYISPNGQAALRGVMETYHASARFILTCNYPNKILPAIHSRCQHINIPKTDHTEFTARAATVLVTEGIEFDIDTLDSYVKATYPDLRKCLNLTQQNSQTGALLAPNVNDRAVGDWKLDCVAMFKAGKMREARTLLCQQSTPEEADVTFRWMYDKLDLWSKDIEQQDQAIIIIRNGIANIPLVADQEINLSATITELCQL